MPLAPARSHSRSPVAVCLAGAPRALDQTASGLRRYLLRALKADLFAYVACSGDNGTAAAVARLSPANLLATGHDAWIALCGNSTKRRAAEGWLARTKLCLLIHGSRELRVADDRELNTIPAAHWGDAARFRGNWLHNSSALQQYFAHLHCLEMIDAHEVWRGKRYLHIVSSRFDLKWLAPHPPLALLDPHSVWVPHTNHYGGYNDRHAVFARRHAEIYFGSWFALISGQAAALVEAAVADRSAYAGKDVNAESWLRIRLDSHGINVKVLPVAAFVACPAETNPIKSLPSRSVTSCDNGRVYKYPGEFGGALRVAFCVATKGTCPKTRVSGTSVLPSLHNAAWSARLFDNCLRCERAHIGRRVHATLRAFVVGLGNTACEHLRTGNVAGLVQSLTKLVGALEELSAGEVVKMGAAQIGVREISAVTAWVVIPRIPQSAKKCKPFLDSCSQRLGLLALKWPPAKRLACAARLLKKQLRRIHRNMTFHMQAPSRWEPRLAWRGAAAHGQC